MRANFTILIPTLLSFSCLEKDPESPVDTGEPVQDTAETTETDTDSDDTQDTEDTQDTNDSDTNDTDTNDSGEDTADTDTDSSDPDDSSIVVGNGVAINFELIPAGTDPQLRYDLSNSFYAMNTEITQGMYLEVMGYESYSGETAIVGQGTNYPAYYISWHMTADFANTLTNFYNTQNNASLNTCYSCTNSGTLTVQCTQTINPYQCDGFRLPTEAEWEYAARSGTTADFWTGEGPELGGNYSIDDCASVTIQDGVGNPPLDDYAWYCGNSNGTSEPVGQKLPNGFGLYDMHGNVWEWTADQGSFTNGCTFPDSSNNPYCTNGENRVMRGGYWNKRPEFLKSSYTISGSPDSRNKYIGSRLIRLESVSGGTGNVTEICEDTCTFANDTECDDGGVNSLYSVCDFGTDCSDCGIRAVCEDTCSDANDGICDDGGPNDLTPFDSLCYRGTDCADCGSY